jgi:F-type H+-transporting ATPase subunit c
MVDAEFTKVAAYVAAGVCAGIGMFGPALGLGFVGGKACESIGKNPEVAPSMMRTMVTALALVESTAIYVFLISLLLVTK